MKMSELMIKIGVDAKDVGPGVNSALKQVKGFQSKMSAMKEMRADFGGYLRNNAGQIADGMNKAGNVMTGLGVAGAAGIFALAKNAAYFADTLDETASKVQLNIEYLQRLRTTTLNMGLAYDTIINGVSLVQNKLAGIQLSMNKTGKVGASGQVFEALGVSVLDTNGKLKTMQQIFPDTIRALQKIENGTLRNAYASKIFGKGWKELAPLMAVSADEFDRMMNSVDVIKEDDIKKAAVYADKIDAMTESIKNMGVRLGINLMPMLEKFLPIFEKSILEPINKALTAFSNMSESQQNLILWFVKAGLGILLLGGPLVKLAGWYINITTAINLYKTAQLAAATASTTATATMAASWTALLPVLGAVSLAILAIVAAYQLAAAYQSQVIDEYKTGDIRNEKTTKMVTANKKSMKQRADELGISLPKLRDMMQKEKGWKGNQGLALDAITGARLKQYETGKMQVPQNIRQQGINKQIGYNMPSSGQFKNNVNVRVFVDDDMKLKAQVVDIAGAVSEMTLNKRLA